MVAFRISFVWRYSLHGSLAVWRHVLPSGVPCGLFPRLCEMDGPSASRGRKRMQYHKCKALLAQHVICTLNWICLGYPSEVPQRAQAGEPLSESQTEVVARIEGLVEHFLHCPAFQVEDLGRTGEKFAALLQAAKELPERCQDVDLLNLLHDIRHHFDSYYQAEPHEEHAASHQECRLDPASVRLPSLVSKPVVASRIKWKCPPSFDPSPYLLDPVVASVFREPDSLRLDPESWPSKKRAKLVHKWDEFGACVLVPCSEIDRP